jgi:hypothetical protein
MSQATNSFVGAVARDRPLEVRSSDAALSGDRNRLLAIDIAMQRVAKKSQTKSAEENFFSNRLDLTQPRIVRFSPATDVLPFSGLHTSPDQLRLSKLQNNNRRGHQAA